jgi:diguanylate cyclase (GGDEF)-like protein
MSQVENRIIDSVADITEETDKKALVSVLVHTLADLLNVEAVLFLHLPKTNESLLEVSASSPAEAFKEKLQVVDCYHLRSDCVELDDLLTACTQEKQAQITAYNQQFRSAYPVIVNGVLTGVLDIYGHDNSDLTASMIKGLLRVYSNFLAIIDDKEHDTLTGLLNRRTFDAQLTELLTDNHAERNKYDKEDRRIEKPDIHSWLGILDIDHFKNINDTYGHIYGDEVLIMFANLMQKTFRNEDLLFRFGGEEFVVVLAPCTEADARYTFDRFRETLAEVTFSQVGHVTVSIGIVKIAHQHHITNILEHADKALYFAKGNGRNQIQLYDELISQGLIEERRFDSDIELF